MNFMEGDENVRPEQMTPRRSGRTRTIRTTRETEMTPTKAVNSATTERLKTLGRSSSKKIQTKSEVKSVTVNSRLPKAIEIQTNDNNISSSSSKVSANVLNRKEKPKNVAALIGNSEEVVKDEQNLNGIDIPNKNERKEESRKSTLPSSENNSIKFTATVMEYNPSQKEEKEASKVNLAQSLIETNSHLHSTSNVTFSPVRHENGITFRSQTSTTTTVIEDHVDTAMNIHQQTALSVKLSKSKHENEKELIDVNQEVGLLSPSIDVDAERPVDVTLLHAEPSIEANGDRRSIFNVTFSPVRHENGEKPDDASLGTSFLRQRSTTFIKDHVDTTMNHPESFIETNLRQTNATFSPVKNENVEKAVNDDSLSTTMSAVAEVSINVQNIAESLIEANSHQQTTLNITYSPIRNGNEEAINSSLGVGLLSPTSVVKRTVDKRLRISSTPRISSSKKLLKRLGTTTHRGIANQRPSRGPPKVSHDNISNLSKNKFFSTSEKETMIDGTKTMLQQKLVTFSSPKPKGKTPAEPRPRVFKFGATTNDETEAGSSSRSKTKLPNFSSIHQTMFAKMESIDETVERRMERSKALSTNKKIRGPKQPTREEKKPVVRKLDASVPPEPAHRILQPLPNGAKLRVERHQEMYKSRSDRSTSDKRSQMLRGVRLNRRFDLQMKFRDEQVDQQE